MIRRLGVVAVLAVSAGCGNGDEGTEPSSPPLSRDQIVAAQRDGDVVVLDRGGRTVRRVTTVDAPRVVTHLALTADRRNVLVGVRIPDSGSSNCSAEVLAIPAGGGRLRTLATSAASPASLPADRVAVAVLERRDDICLRVAVDVVDGSGERKERFFLREPVPDDTPPGQMMSASPDGRLVAFVGNDGLEILDTATRSMTPVPSGTRLFAPAFATNNRLLAQQECCLAGMELVEVDLDGTVTSIAPIKAPLEAADAGNGARSAVLVTALHQLHLLEGGVLGEPIATGVVSAAA